MKPQRRTGQKTDMTANTNTRIIKAGCGEGMFTPATLMGGVIGAGYGVGNFFFMNITTNQYESHRSDNHIAQGREASQIHSECKKCHDFRPIQILICEILFKYSHSLRIYKTKAPPAARKI
jgi:hypothetical protein